MKKIYLFILVMSLQFVHAQTPDLLRAQRFFDRTYYSEAIPIYESAMQKSPSFIVTKNLADSYYFTNEYVKAQLPYQWLFLNYKKEMTEEYYFRYMQTLKATGDFKKGNAVTLDFLTTKNSPQAIEDFNKELKTLDNIVAIGARFEIKNLVMNSAKSEFSAVQLGDQLVYSGIKSKSSLFDNVYRWNDELYLDLLQIPLKNKMIKDSSSISFSKELNTAVHEANAIFTKDGKTVYFTRNNSKKGRHTANKFSILQIFKAELKDGKWTNIKALPFSSDTYSVEHPALSYDEKTLYFASDMPGSLGSFDIYSVAIVGDSYGAPKNLGSKINTKRKEQFPFISNDNKLYFSSDGHVGFGAMDVFVATIQDGTYSEPLNVGLPVNSAFDDFSFWMNPDLAEGYFASNRPGGKGGDDIYEFKETKALIIEDCKQYIAGTIIDVDTKQTLDSTVVVLFNKDKIALEKIFTKADGQFSFEVGCETAFSVEASKKGFTTEIKNIQTNGIRLKKNDASLALKSFEVIEKEKAEVIALQKEKEDAIALRKKRDAEARAEKEKRDRIAAEEKEIEEDKVKKKEKIATIIATEKDVVKVKDQLVIKTDPIYFDYDLWYIRKESKTILNRVVELMKKYPEMVIEIGSHTDSRGTDKYNKNLSGNRAQSTADYIIGQGIEKNRILAKGYGASVPIVKCSSCTEEQHELNRRSEFVIKNL